MTKETGGPAFPRRPYIVGELGSEEYKGGQTGMTLRDWFAGQALVGLLAMVQNECADVWKSNDKAAEYAYQYADAMLAARKDSDEAKEKN